MVEYVTGIAVGRVQVDAEVHLRYEVSRNNDFHQSVERTERAAGRLLKAYRGNVVTGLGRDGDNRLLVAATAHCTVQLQIVVIERMTSDRSTREVFDSPVPPIDPECSFYLYSKDVGTVVKASNVIIRIHRVERDDLLLARRDHRERAPIRWARVDGRLDRAENRLPRALSPGGAAVVGSDG